MQTKTDFTKHIKPLITGETTIFCQTVPNNVGDSAICTVTVTWWTLLHQNHNGFMQIPQDSQLDCPVMRSYWVNANWPYAIYTKFSLHNAENTCYILHNSQTARCTNFCRAWSNWKWEHAFITAIHHSTFSMLTRLFHKAFNVYIISDKINGHLDLQTAKNSFLFIHDPFLSKVWTLFLINIRPN